MGKMGIEELKKNASCKVEFEGKDVCVTIVDLLGDTLTKVGGVLSDPDEMCQLIPLCPRPTTSEDETYNPIKVLKEKLPLGEHCTRLFKPLNFLETTGMKGAVAEGVKSCEEIIFAEKEKENEKGEKEEEKVKATQAEIDACKNMAG